MDNSDFQSPNFSFPYIAPAQTQKHVTHNEALRMIDALLHISITDRIMTTPPENPSEGQQGLIGAVDFGAWQGKFGHVAVYQDGAWETFAPQAGWTVWDNAASELLVFQDGGWNVITSGETPAPLEFGINTAADSTNRLSVKSDAALLSHDDVTPGSGDIRLVMNKSSTVNTASLLYQTGFEGRAELGLSGDDSFHLKVSADGQSWREGLRIDPNSAKVSLPHTPPSSVMSNLLPDAGRFAGAPEPQGVSAANFALPSYLSPYNGAVFEQGAGFIHNNGSYGGSDAALDPIMDSWVSQVKDINNRRYGIEFFTLKITAGAGVNGRLSAGGLDYYLALSNQSAPISLQMSVLFYISVVSGEVVIGREGDRYVDGILSEEAAYSIDSAVSWKQIVHLLDDDGPTSLGYKTNLFRIYASPGSVFHIAAPAIMAGHIEPKANEYHGIIPGARAWG